MPSILNVGTSAVFWVAFLKAAILISLLCWIGFTTYKLTKLSPGRKKWKQTIKLDIVLGVIAIVYVFFVYVAFGPGKTTSRVDVEDIGTSKLMKEKPAEKTVEEIRKNAYERKPEQLKRQDDPSFAKEKEEADAQMDEILKRAEKREKGE